MRKQRTQVGIIGAGPAGLLLARLLHRQGIAVSVLERRSRDYVEGRIRAGVLEQGTAAIIASAGAQARMQAECLVHDGLSIAFDGRMERIDLRCHTGSPVIIYGQTEITRDLNQLNLADGIELRFDSPVREVRDPASDHPVICFESEGRIAELACDFVAGCDGFHGISRGSVPAAVLREYERVYPIGWLGLLSETRPAATELIYANTQRGFALCSQRSHTLARNYIDVPATDALEQWSDQSFWDELRRRLPGEVADTLETGPAIEKSIAPLRSYVATPMRYGSLFLVGDAAHIVPPTGAKGLNLAASDAAMLASALIAWFTAGDSGGLERYSDTALARVWQAERFSWWFTQATHRLSEQPFDRRMQLAELEHVTTSETGQRNFAEQYVGLPIIDPVRGGPLAWASRPVSNPGVATAQ